MADMTTTEKPALLGEDCLGGYDRGEAALLVGHRTAALGHLLVAERAVPYVQILYRLLIFRREHELEPLYDDIYNAVTAAQEIVARESYSADRFREDMRQLEAWSLVDCRIEKQRLRGYRDQRRAKFRYRLTDECSAFLQWLEERLEEDFEPADNDTRDLLEEICGSLSELLRLLNRSGTIRADEGDARRVLYQLHKLSEITYQVNDGLSAFNARMLSFLIGVYDVQEIRQIVEELERYVEKFLHQVHVLRYDALPDIEKLLLPRLQKKLTACLDEMEAERRSSPHLYRGRNALNLAHVPEQLNAFCRERGTLARLCSRINQTAIEVWRRLHAHLRELQRKSTRLEDIRSRLEELAQWPEDVVPREFMRRLLSAAQMCSDPHYWDEAERAVPDQPRRYSPRQKPPPTYLSPKTTASKPVRSLDEARLEELKAWIEATVTAGQSIPARVSQGRFSEFDDLTQIIELAKAGFFCQGRRLERISFALSASDEQVEVMLEDEQQLDFRDLELHEAQHG